MVYKYVLIDTIDVNEREVENALKKLPNITDINPTVVEETAMADPIFENYNIAVKVEAESNDEIEKIIESDIKKLSGIKNIKTYMKK